MAVTHLPAPPPKVSLTTSVFLEGTRHHEFKSLSAGFVFQPSVESEEARFPRASAPEEIGKALYLRLPWTVGTIFIIFPRPFPGAWTPTGVAREKMQHTHRHTHRHTPTHSLTLRSRCSFRPRNFKVKSAGHFYQAFSSHQL